VSAIQHTRPVSARSSTLDLNRSLETFCHALHGPLCCAVTKPLECPMPPNVTAEATASPSADDKKWKMVDARIRRRGSTPDSLIEVLHSIQEAFGYLELDVLEYVANALGVPLSRVYGVATFYSLFTLKPQGEHTLTVCSGTACYINSATAIFDHLRERLGVKPGETTKDGNLSLLSVRCLSACGMAPAVVLDDVLHGMITPESIDVLLEEIGS